MNKTQNALNSTTQRMKALEEAAKRASSRVRIMGERMDSIGGKMRSVGSSVAMTSGIAFGALALSLRDAVQVGIDFEKQMSKVHTISGGSAAEIAKLREQAKNSVQPLSLQQVRQRMHRVLAIPDLRLMTFMMQCPGCSVWRQLPTGIRCSRGYYIKYHVCLCSKSKRVRTRLGRHCLRRSQRKHQRRTDGRSHEVLAPNANSLGWGMEESVPPLWLLVTQVCKVQLQGRLLVHP